jgi:predicted DNA-binding transcriptional regulator YafY
MPQRLSNLDRTLKLVHALTQSIEGLTLDEMAALLGVNRRTLERMRNVILIHFDLEEMVDGRLKRFRIKDSPGRAYARPSSAEVAALQSVVEAGRQEGTANTDALEKLLSKTKIAFDSAERRRLDNDLELLTKLQRSRVAAGPAVIVSPEDLTTIQSAILASHCVDFDYRPGWADDPSWRRVIPFGLIHGPITYLLGKMPDRDDPPFTFRLDRMTNVRDSGVVGCPSEDWDLDAWMARSFGIWQEADHDIVFRILPHATERARAWRFHPKQQIEEDGEELVVSFSSGGLVELANHLFGWAGDLIIEQPEALKDVMCERLAAAQSMVRPYLS